MGEEHTLWSGGKDFLGDRSLCPPVNPVCTVLGALWLVILGFTIPKIQGMMVAPELSAVASMCFLEIQV